MAFSIIPKWYRQDGLSGGHKNEKAVGEIVHRNRLFIFRRDRTSTRLMKNNRLGFILFFYWQGKRDDDSTHDIPQFKIMLAAQDMSIVTIHTGL